MIHEKILFGHKRKFINKPVIVSKAVLFVKDFFHTFDLYITNFPQICDRKTKFFEFSYYILDFFDLHTSNWPFSALCFLNKKL